MQKVGSRGIQLLVSIVLARILTPKDFGLMGMLAIFIEVSQTLINGGFNQALIQKKDADEEDYSSVFYINLLASIALYGILFFCAPLIADFYRQPILVPMTRVLAVVFIINAFAYVQQARLTKFLQFKTLMFIHIPSTVISGVISIVMAWAGFGVWSIVAQQIVMRLAYAIQLWIHSKWTPLQSFNRQRAKKLFSFGGKLMVSGLLDSAYSNIYLIVIGKFFPVDVLGYYQNARNLARTPTNTLSSVLSSVTYPAFSTIQDDNARLKAGYKRSIEQLLFWLCPISVFAGVLATPLFRFILTAKWLPAVPYFQLLCVVGILFPLNSFNLNIINVKGRSDLFLKLEIIKKVIVTIGIIATLPFGIWALVIFQAANSFIAYFINSYYSGRFIQYPMGEQIRDIMPILLLTAGTGLLIGLTDHFLSGTPDIARLVVGFGLGSVLYWMASRFWKLAPYLEFKHFFQTKLVNRFSK
jgi:O-antigen/teichoic acid export membrane protein